MAKAAQEATEVVKQEAQLPAEMMDMFVADAGSGFEEANANSYAIPFLYILQSGSPQVKKSDGAYIKGAEEGMFYNTVTGEVIDGSVGVKVVSCHYKQRFVEWQSRESGGGFVKEHGVDTDLVNQTKKDDKNRDVLPNGHLLVDTRYHYVLILGPDNIPTPALITMSSTQLRKSRQWMSKMNGIKIQHPVTGQLLQAPMNSRIYHLTTVPESNDKGSWFGFKIEMCGVVTDSALYNASKEFAEAVRSGKVEENMNNAEGGTTTAGNQTFTDGVGADDDKPF